MIFFFLMKDKLKPMLRSYEEEDMPSFHPKGRQLVRVTWEARNPWSTDRAEAMPQPRWASSKNFPWPVGQEDILQQLRAAWKTNFNSLSSLQSLTTSARVVVVEQNMENFRVINVTQCLKKYVILIRTL